MLGCDELLNVRVIDPKDAHLCAATVAAAGDGLTNCVEDAHEADRTGRLGL